MVGTATRVVVGATRSVVEEARNLLDQLTVHEGELDDFVWQDELDAAELKTK